MPHLIQRPVQRTEREEQDSLNFIAQTLKVLVKAPVHDAIGVSLGYLLHCAYLHPEVMRRVLNEPVVREGFRGSTMIVELQRVARG